MQRYLALGAVLALMVLVVSRVYLLKRSGIRAMKFGEMDRKDYLLPPAFLLYLYLLVASVFDLPGIGQELFSHGGVAWLGAGTACLGLLLFLVSLVSFGKSFRIGIDEDAPGRLVTTGIFAHTRNPIYLAFGLVFLGVFLIIPNWVFLLYLLAGAFVVDRQVHLEEASLEKTYGEEYRVYCRKVPRYLP